MDRPRLVVNSQRKRELSPWQSVCLTDAETQQLLTHFLEDKREVPEADVLTLVDWGNARKREAVILALALAGKVRVIVRGHTVSVVPCPTDATA